MALFLVALLVRILLNALEFVYYGFLLNSKMNQELFSMTDGFIYATEYIRENNGPK